MRWLVMAFWVLLSASLAAAAQAQSDNTWADDLTTQMAVEFDCDVTYYSHVVERVVDGTTILFAKVHCLDDRAFDAEREGERVMFNVRPCETRPTVC